MYYECHITIGLHPKSAQYAIEALNWKFSEVAGDAILGPGAKQYATRHAPGAASLESVKAHVAKTADILEFMGFPVLRCKIELVIWDHIKPKKEQHTCVNKPTTAFTRPASLNPLRVGLVESSGDEHCGKV